MACKLTSGASVSRVKRESWNSSHGLFRMTADAMPGLRAAQRLSVSPPVECPNSTRRRGAPRGCSACIAASAAAMSASYSARSEMNPGVCPGRRLRPYLRRSRAKKRAPRAVQNRASRFWKK